MQTDAHSALIQVVPPGQGGVLDYLLCLKGEWERMGVASHVIALSNELARQRSLADRVSNCVGHAAGPCCVVLHFSGYGYAKRGLCFWLLAEIAALRLQHRQGLRLVVVFHELFAAGPVWKSAFWLSPWQAQIARRLARHADALWTNTQQHARWLRGTVGSTTPIHVRPVFSNIGEPEAVPAPGQRQARAVVFGSTSTRQRALDGLAGHEAALQQLGVEELVEVGSGPASTPGPITMPCRHAGRLEAAELGQLLQESRFGLLDYPAEFLGKSGVFAAYAAHGCVILDTCQPGPDTDGLVAGSQYLALPAVARSPSAHPNVDTTAANAARWYANHRLSGQARELLSLACGLRTTTSMPAAAMAEH